jgi:putative transposase
MRKTFKYRLFTTRLESELLGVQLGEACRLYNAALEERRDARKRRVSINYYDQANQPNCMRPPGPRTKSYWSGSIGPCVRRWPNYCARRGVKNS